MGGTHQNNFLSDQFRQREHQQLYQVILVGLGGSLICHTAAAVGITAWQGEVALSDELDIAFVDVKELPSPSPSVAPVEKKKVVVKPLLQPSVKPPRQVPLKPSPSPQPSIIAKAPVSPLPSPFTQPQPLTTPNPIFAKSKFSSIEPAQILETPTALNPTPSLQPQNKNLDHSESVVIKDNQLASNNPRRNTGFKFEQSPSQSLGSTEQTSESFNITPGNTGDKIATNSFSANNSQNPLTSNNPRRGTGFKFEQSPSQSLGSTEQTSENFNITPGNTGDKIATNSFSANNSQNPLTSNNPRRGTGFKFEQSPSQSLGSTEQTSENFNITPGNTGDKIATNSFSANNSQNPLTSNNPRRGTGFKFEQSPSQSLGSTEQTSENFNITPGNTGDKIATNSFSANNSQNPLTSNNPRRGTGFKFEQSPSQSLGSTEQTSESFNITPGNTGDKIANSYGSSSGANNQLPSNGQRSWSGNIATNSHSETLGDAYSSFDHPGKNPRKNRQTEIVCIENCNFELQEGSVEPKVLVTMTTDGRVANAQIKRSSGNVQADSSVIEAAKRMRFARPPSSSNQVTVNFVIKDSEEYRRAQERRQRRQVNGELD